MRVVFYNEQVEALGIEYLSAVLKSAGHQATLVYRPALFANYRVRIPGLETLLGGRLQDTVSEILAKSPDLLAFTVNISNMYNVVKLIRLVRQKSRVPIVVGGPMATSSAEFFLKHDLGDFVVIGEGEDAFLELVDALDSGRDPSRIRNLWFKRQEGVIRNPARPFVTDLDQIPFPDRTLYQEHGAVFGIIMAGRGCPFSCSYCFSGTGFRRTAPNPRHYYRIRDPLKVVQEASEAKTRYKVRWFHFMDDIFPVKRSWLETFFEAWKRDVNRPFDIYMAPIRMDRSLVRKLADAGCRHVNIGLQSAVPRIYRDLMGRRFKLEDVVALVRDLSANGITVAVENIIGVPTETRKEMLESMEWTVKHLPQAFVYTYKYVPLPGTPMAALAARVSGQDPETWLETLMEQPVDYRGTTFFVHPESDLANNIQDLEKVIGYIPESLRRRVLEKPSRTLKFVLKPAALVTTLWGANINWLPSYLLFYESQIGRLLGRRIKRH